jgi:NAD(P)-dependent dehydrogenase (short-subunit alcohol dehydrogenase family)
VRLEGKVAVVTGGGRGIGEAISMALAREGCSVAIPDVILPNAEKVAEQIRALGRDALAVECDITDLQSVESAFTQVITLALRTATWWLALRWRPGRRC